MLLIRELVDEICWDGEENVLVRQCRAVIDDIGLSQRKNDKLELIPLTMNKKFSGCFVSLYQPLPIYLLLGVLYTPQHHSVVMNSLALSLSLRLTTTLSWRPKMTHRSNENNNNNFWCSMRYLQWQHYLFKNNVLFASLHHHLSLYSLSLSLLL